MPDDQVQLSLNEATRLAMDHLKTNALDAAEDVFRSILASVPDHPTSLNYLGVIQHKRGQDEEALRLMRRSIELQPDDARFLQNLGGLLNNCARHEEAIEPLRRAVELGPHDFTALGNLCMAYSELGLEEESRQFGQRALEEKDRQACDNFAARHSAAVERAAAPPFDVSDRRKNVIAFSLWGEDPYYVEGAIANAMLGPQIYPEWMCRFYCDLSVPRTVIERLTAHGAQVVQYNVPTQGTYGLFWRFFAANDPQVDRFLCRDCDCRLNVKERVAVEQWIASGECFHIMRDNMNHCELMLAGMWGGVAGILPDLEPLTSKYYQSYAQRWVDQHFLREEIWPRIKHLSLAHDSYYEIGNFQRFPQFGTLPRPLHVGGSAPRPQSQTEKLTGHV